MLKRNVHRIILLILDALIVSVALALAYLLRRDFNLEPEYRTQYIYILPVVLVIRLALFFLFKLYKGMLRYASISELIAIVSSSTVGTFIFIILNIILENLHRFGPMPIHSNGEHVLRVPWGVLVNEWFLVIVLIGGERFSRRFILTFGFRLPKDARRVLIVGAGDLGDAVARQLMKEPMRGYKPVCFVDDDPLKIGKYIHRLPVVGGLKNLPDAIERYRIDDVILAMEDISPLKLRQVIKDCKTTLVTFRIAPNVHDLIEGKIEVSQIRKVEIEDLLGREPVRLILPKEKNYIRGERVLVTGAGGSIGSELCRQLATYEPECILFLGRGENSIYEIAAEFDYRFKGNRIIPVIADVTDEIRLREVFEEYHPTICFHAAAHKHVPLMEMYPQEAVRNNIIGTLNVARLADECGAKIFVLISTDKAVNPTNVMGATKRLAEMIIFSLAERSKTTFLAVRFGNVLGSRGSVIPLFKKQIERGGPVTVTHPDVMRYFMTIPEAVSLVLQTGAMRDKGRLFVLDMGEPVKIIDLARNLIALSGFEPEKDVEIVFTGLRPGEKICEELVTEGEDIHKTEMGKIFVMQTQGCDWDTLMKDVDTFGQYIRDGNIQAIRALLKRLVPTYKYTPTVQG